MPVTNYPLVLFIVALCLVSENGFTHHAPLLYDSSTSIKLDATVDGVKMQNPHSRMEVTVITKQGNNEQWVISLPGANTSKRQKQYLALNQLKPGDKLTITGWPHKVNVNEIRSEKIVFPDGKIRRQVTNPNFQHKDNIALKKILANPENIVDDFDPAVSEELRIQSWVAENRYIERLAKELHTERAAFINIIDADQSHYPGIEEHLQCLPAKTHFLTINSTQSTWAQETASIEFISTYNDLLARHFEMQLITCGH